VGGVQCMLIVSSVLMDGWRVCTRLDACCVLVFNALFYDLIIITIAFFDTKLLFAVLRGNEGTSDLLERVGSGFM
jgi:hypothetical protein